MVLLSDQDSPSSIETMRFDQFVYARMLAWNPKLNLLDREAVIAACRGAVNFDAWHCGRVVARAEIMRKGGHIEVWRMGDTNGRKWE